MERITSSVPATWSKVKIVRNSEKRGRTSNEDLEGTRGIKKAAHDDLINTVKGSETKQIAGVQSGAKKRLDARDRLKTESTVKGGN